MPNSPWSLPLEALRPLLYLASVALLVTVLSQARAVLIPIALAVLLAFILSPLVEALERRLLPRVVAVAVVVILALSIIGTFAYTLNRQFNDLATQLPHYSRSIKEKFATLRATRTGAIANIQKTVEEVNRELDKQEQQHPPGSSGTQPSPEVKKDVQPVMVVPTEPTDVQRLRAVLEPVFEPLATAGIVLIMVIFMLMQREDLRNRFIRLVGRGRVTLTTKMMDEAGQRISQFLFTQLLINVGFGTVVTLGLLWIGVPYALLWGVAAGLLRFVPYIGALLALLLPTAIAFVIFPGWWHALATLGLFLTLDAVIANIFEPLIIGHRTGVFSLALLLMALFWVWLWGPIGLLLSTPLTVCLAVLGKHIPQLEFLAVLLSDEPVLEPEISYYQRLLAGDEDEANEIVEQNLQKGSLTQTVDEVLIPAMLLAARDRAREEISDAEHQLVLQEIQATVARLPLIQKGQEPEAAESDDGANKPRLRILGIPARSEGSRIALELLSQVLDPSTYELHSISTATLASEVVTQVEQQQPDLLCITALPPGGLTQARYLCKRLRTRFTAVRSLVVRPGLKGDQDFDRQTIVQRLTESGADKVALSITEAQAQIAQFLSATLAQPAAPAPAAAEGQPATVAGGVVTPLPSNS